ncbi:MAG: hypothetical protein D6694_09575 [Gammaproteobacteria bacterium]|nr:MAG: hypothetical protein D6694_09575 [Gammaproteobacteria bacterium]
MSGSCIIATTILGSAGMFLWVALLMLADKQGVSLREFFQDGQVRKAVFLMTGASLIVLPILIFVASIFGDYLETVILHK